MDIQFHRCCRFVLIAALVLTAILLSACNVSGKITVYRGESWNAVFEVGLPKWVVDLYGKAQIDSGARDSASRLQPLDVDVCWRSKPDSVGGLIYTFEYEGGNFGSLLEVGREYGVSLSVNQRDDTGQLEVSANPSVELVTFSQLQLAGAKIVSSDADEVSGGTATWRSPNHRLVSALLNPARRNPFMGLTRSIKRLFDPCEK